MDSVEKEWQNHCVSAAIVVDDVLFTQALNNNHHVLQTLLPNKLDITYQLRHRRNTPKEIKFDYTLRFYHQYVIQRQLLTAIVLLFIVYSLSVIGLRQ